MGTRSSVAVAIRPRPSPAELDFAAPRTVSADPCGGASARWHLRCQRHSATAPQRSPRTSRAEDRSFEAALEEYGERGWSGFTMDAVARRAGVGKSTVYLRRQGKDSLLAVAVRARSGSTEAIDTGSFRRDLEALVTHLFRYYLAPGGWATLRMAADAAGAAEPLGNIAAAVGAVHRAASRQISEWANEHGEIPSDFPVTLRQPKRLGCGNQSYSPG